MDFKNTKFSFEIFPPKKNSAAIDSVYGTIDELAGLKPDFISVTYGAGGSIINNKTVELASYIKNKKGISSLSHLTCINSVKDDIDLILTELKKNNIRKILALRGDKSPEFKNARDFSYAVELIKYIKSKGDFEIYGACYPEGHLEADTLMADIEALKIKVDAGVCELISQLFFDNEVYFRFLEKAEKSGVNVPVNAGIMPVTNVNSILRMTVMCGASVPRELMKILNKYQHNEEDMKKAGIDYSVKQIQNLIDNGIYGIHLYTMNNPEVAKAIIL